MEEKKKCPELRFRGYKDDWLTDEVGAFYEFKNGLNKGKEYFGHGKPIVNFTDVFHKRGLYASQLSGKVDVTREEIQNHNVKKGDLFFTRTSETIEEIGFSAVMLDETENAVFSGFVLRARAIEIDPLVNTFKKFAFNTPSFRSEMVMKSSMTTRALTSGTAIRKMYFSFPKSKDEQRKIGRFITNVEILIDQHRVKLEKLVNLKKAMLEKMFPKEGETVPEIRFKGFEGDWKENVLSELLALLKDGTHGTHKDVDQNGVYLLSAKNIKNGKIHIDISDRKISIHDYKEIHKNFRLKKGDILLTIVGSIGESAILKNPFGLTFQRSVAYLRPNYLLDNQFLYTLINSNSFQSELLNRQVTSAQPGIYLGELERIAIKFPPIEEQKKISLYFKNIEGLIFNQQKQLHKLINLKQAFSEKMFV